MPKRYTDQVQWTFIGKKSKELVGQARKLMGFFEEHIRSRVWCRRVDGAYYEMWKAGNFYKCRITTPEGGKVEITWPMGIAIKLFSEDSLDNGRYLLLSKGNSTYNGFPIGHPVFKEEFILNHTMVESEEDIIYDDIVTGRATRPIVQYVNGNQNLYFSTNLHESGFAGQNAPIARSTNRTDTQRMFTHAYRNFSDWYWFQDMYDDTFPVFGPFFYNPSLNKKTQRTLLLVFDWRNSTLNMISNTIAVYPPIQNTTTVYTPIQEPEFIPNEDLYTYYKILPVDVSALNTPSGYTAGWYGEGTTIAWATDSGNKINFSMLVSLDSGDSATANGHILSNFELNLDLSHPHAAIPDVSLEPGSPEDESFKLTHLGNGAFDVVAGSTLYTRRRTGIPGSASGSHNLYDCCNNLWSNDSDISYGSRWDYTSGTNNNMNYVTIHDFKTKYDEDDAKEDGIPVEHLTAYVGGSGSGGTLGIGEAQISRQATSNATASMVCDMHNVKNSSSEDNIGTETIVSTVTTNKALNSSATINLKIDGTVYPQTCIMSSLGSSSDLNEYDGPQDDSGDWTSTYSQTHTSSWDVDTIMPIYTDVLNGVRLLYKTSSNYNSSAVHSDPTNYTTDASFSLRLEMYIEYDDPNIADISIFNYIISESNSTDYSSSNTNDNGDCTNWDIPVLDTCMPISYFDITDSYSSTTVTCGANPDCDNWTTTITGIELLPDKNYYGEQEYDIVDAITASLKQYAYYGVSFVEAWAAASEAIPAVSANNSFSVGTGFGSFADLSNVNSFYPKYPAVLMNEPRIMIYKGQSVIILDMKSYTINNSVIPAEIVIVINGKKVTEENKLEYGIPDFEDINTLFLC